MPRSPRGWTLDTLATHLTQKIDDVEIRTQERFALSKQAVDAALQASEKAISAAMAAAEKAVTKAETAAEKRFDSVNEFRAAMKDQTANFADREQVDFRLTAIEKKMDNFSGQVAGVANTWWLITGIVGVVFGVVGIASFILRFIH
jgi:small-conductance mechanosensitive channel